jgi:hypothetical protein
MQIIKNENQLYEHKFIVAGKHPKPHFQGYYHLLFDKLQNLDIVVSMQSFTKDFLRNYDGNIICLAPHYSRQLSYPWRKYRTILISHGPLPMSCRISKAIKADYLISNGSKDLIDQVDLTHVGHLCTAGYFPTAYAMPDRKDKTAFVQITGKYQCRFTLTQVCKLLLDQNFKVYVYNHLLYKSNFTKLPKEVKKVQTGLEYIQTLSSCSHYIFSGTSGFITNMYTHGACMIVLSQDWIERNKPIFQDILKKSCYIAQDENELRSYLVLPAKYDTEMISFLYGRERHNILEKINEYLLNIC